MAEARPVVGLLAFWTSSVRVLVVAALVQFNVVGASDILLAFLKVTTTTNVFADGETVRFVPSRRAVLVLKKIEAVPNSLSTRAICARAGAANRSKATPQSSGKITRTKRGRNGLFPGNCSTGKNIRGAPWARKARASNMTRGC